MSQFLCSSLQTKNYLSPNKDMSSSHPIFWSQRKPLSDIRSSELFSWSYPPKTNICAKVLAQISAKLTNYNSNLTNGSFVNPLKVGNNPLIEEMFSTQVIKRLSPNFNCVSTIDKSCAMSQCSDCMCDSSSLAERTAFSFDDKLCNNSFNNCYEDISVDSDSSNERTNKIQINDSKVLDSMQNDRQRKKKRKRRRRKKKSGSTPSTQLSPKKCFLSECRKDFISFLFESESDYDTNEDITDTDFNSNEELSICLEIGSELEEMCQNLFVDYFFGNQSHNKSDNKEKTDFGSDEIDFCHNFCDEISPSVELKSDEEDLEINAINESIRKANDVWNRNYFNVSDNYRKPLKVSFTSNEPSVRVLRVWDYASRRSRCGQWEQIARDRQRFAEKCLRIESEIGFIFSEDHRKKIFNSRFN